MQPGIAPISLGGGSGGGSSGGGDGGGGGVGGGAGETDDGFGDMIINDLASQNGSWSEAERIKKKMDAGVDALTQNEIDKVVESFDNSLFDDLKKNIEGDQPTMAGLERFQKDHPPRFAYFLSNKRGAKPPRRFKWKEDRASVKSEDLKEKCKNFSLTIKMHPHRKKETSNVRMDTEPFLLIVKRRDNKKRKTMEDTLKQETVRVDGVDTLNTQVDGDVYVHGIVYANAFRSPGQDLAEFLPASQVEDRPIVGDVVVLTPASTGETACVSKKTTCFPKNQLLVVSDESQASFIGGEPGPGKVICALQGQVRVNIVPVKKNEQYYFVVASGQNDGKARLVPHNAEPCEEQCVGLALKILPDNQALVLIRSVSKPAGDIPNQLAEFRTHHDKVKEKVLLNLQCDMTDHDRKNISKAVKSHLVDMSSPFEDQLIAMDDLSRRAHDMATESRNPIGCFFGLLRERKARATARATLNIDMDAAYTPPPLRDYQKSCIDQTLELRQDRQHGIIVLGTGTGKTRIAMEIICHVLKKHPDKSVVMLAPTTSLVYQHVEVIRRHMKSINSNISVKNGCNIAVASARSQGSGGMIWVITPEKWRARNWQHPALDVSALSMLVFDEVHNVVSRQNESGSSRHPYYRLLERIRDKTKDDNPNRVPQGFFQLIGLTASPQKNKELLKFFGAGGPPAKFVRPDQKSIDTLKDLVASSKNTRRDRPVKERDSDAEFQHGIVSLLKEMMGVGILFEPREVGKSALVPSSEKERVQAFARFGYNNDKLKPKFTKGFQRKLEAQAVSPDHCLRQLSVVLSMIQSLSLALRISIELGWEAAIQYLFSREGAMVSKLVHCWRENGLALEFARRFLKNKTTKWILEQPRENWLQSKNPKYLELRKLLRGPRASVPPPSAGESKANSTCVSSAESRAVIFVNYRESAWALKKLIENDPELNLLYHPEFCVGRGANGGAASVSMTTHQQSMVLSQFKDVSTKVNLLIATSVLYEGIDVQSCNMVIMFSSVGRGVSLLQAAGRARQPGSIFSVLYYTNSAGNHLEERHRIKSNRELDDIVDGIHVMDATIGAGKIE